MERLNIKARPDWKVSVERDTGFTYYGASEDETRDSYWTEDACYRLTLPEVELIEDATNELYRICLLAVERVVGSKNLMDIFGIPASWQDYIQKSWKRQDLAILGRFDLVYDEKKKTVKMLEFNADTPTTAIETSLVQWFWLRDYDNQAFKECRQFNSLHEKIMSSMQKIKLRYPNETFYVTTIADAEEDYKHSLYYQDIANQVGFKNKFIDLKDIGWDYKNKNFVDLDNKPIKLLHKLYPWEWIMTDEFGDGFLEDNCVCLEPVWKMILSNKAILVILSEMFPNHPNLLVSSFSKISMGNSYVVKPILSREGANIRIVHNNKFMIETGGTYGEGEMIYQEYCELPQYNGNNVMIGSWIADGESAGIIIRESQSPIITNNSSIVPHYFVE